MKIESIEHLKKEANSWNDDFQHFYIVLAGGLAKSSKRIVYYPSDKLFGIINEFDESHLEVSEQELRLKTNIPEAIEKGCFYKSSF